MELCYIIILYSLIANQTWIVIAPEIFYVLPDNSTNGSCPSQPCATLSQYLMDNNGTLPVVSNVEYHFPGEHQILANIELINIMNNLNLLEC